MVCRLPPLKSDIRVETGQNPLHTLVRIPCAAHRPTIRNALYRTGRVLAQNGRSTFAVTY